jgi:ribose 5-phosphate isomerase A
VQGRERAPAQPELRRAQELREAATLLIALAPLDAISQDGLTGGVPILLDADEWEEIAEALDDEFLGDATIWRRPMSGTADPSGVRTAKSKKRSCALPHTHTHVPSTHVA